MNKRQSILTLSIVVALGLPGLSFAETYGERSIKRDVATRSTVTRAQVMQEAADFRANPLSAGGLYRWAGGEIGWELVASRYGEPAASATTRAAVLQDLAAFRRSGGVSPDGLYREVGGEIGWELVARR